MGGVILAYILNRSAPKKQKILQYLNEIKDLSKLKAESDAISRDIMVRADNILSSALQCYFGNSNGIGENLKKAKYLYNRSEYNELWNAHKVRNKVVHEQYSPNPSEVKKSLYIFAKAVGKLL